MSRCDASDPWRRLARTAERLSGRPLGRAEREQFRKYLEMLQSWNKVQRLTALDSPAAIVDGLFADSLLFLPLLPDRPISMLDIGAGAGIPGIPLRIVDPAIALTLIESKRKRVSFLRTVQRNLGLDGVSVLEGRAEAVISERPALSGTFDVAVSRAVALDPELLAVARRYLKPGGLFLASGPPVGRRPGPLPAGIRVEVQRYLDLGRTRTFLVSGGA